MKVNDELRRLAGHGESTTAIKRMVGCLRQNNIKTDNRVVEQIRAERKQIASYSENVVIQNVIRRNKNLRGDSHLGKATKMNSMT